MLVIKDSSSDEFGMLFARHVITAANETLTTSRTIFHEAIEHKLNAEKKLTFNEFSFQEESILCLALFFLLSSVSSQRREERKQDHRHNSMGIFGSGT